MAMESSCELGSDEQFADVRESGAESRKKGVADDRKGVGKREHRGLGKLGLRWEASSSRGNSGSGMPGNPGR